MQLGPKTATVPYRLGWVAGRIETFTQPPAFRYQTPALGVVCLILKRGERLLKHIVTERFFFIRR